MYTPIMIGTSFLVVAFFTTSVETTAEHMPITIPMLLMLLPTTLPKIRSVCEPTTAAILAANSGVDVPYATIVKTYDHLTNSKFFGDCDAA